ncbi:MAG: Uma2 family endonuclease [Candidatus Tectimicrobiota bacterium]
MPSQAHARLTVEEYLAYERHAPYKSEYFNGEIFAMSGASRRHNLIALNIGAELRAQLKQRPCEVYTSDMRVKISPTGLYTYPDVVVVCEEPVFEDAEVDTLLNPTVLVEVLSKSTADYDRGEKFEHYRALLSVQEYLLVAQERCHVVHYTRQPGNTWLLTETYDRHASIHLPSMHCDLLLSEVYAKVSLDQLIPE